MKGKIHYRDDRITTNAPYWEKEKWKDRGESGALCGYVRKNTTRNKEDVTCFYCKNALLR